MNTNDLFESIYLQKIAVNDLTKGTLSCVIQKLIWFSLVNYKMS